MTQDRSSITHPVVSHDEWLSARTAFLAKEKEFTRLRDELNRERRALPWEAVEKEYVFEGPKGKEALPDLFEGRSQLIVYHFMFDPSWEAGCPHCSFWADNFNGIVVHLNQRDATLVAVFSGALHQARGVPEAHGLDLQVALVLRVGLQLRLLRVLHPGGAGRKEAFYNYTRQNPGRSAREGVSVFFKDPASRPVVSSGMTK